MQNYDTRSRSRIGGVSNYAIAIVLLVAVIGGLAWVAQYLPSRTKNTQVEDPTKDTNKKPVVSFNSFVAQWGDKKVGKDEKAVYPPRDFEPGTKGHYDFLFKNIHDKDIEVVGFTSTCDCTSMKASALSDAEWERLAKAQDAKPGEPLPYYADPSWRELPKLATDGSSSVSAILTLKPTERGVVRIEWSVKKAPGQSLKLSPAIAFRVVGDSMIGAHPLSVPAQVRPPLQFDPARIKVGLLTANSVVTATFNAWSSTRDSLKFSLATADPHFDFVIKECTPKECADLEQALFARQIPTHVRCAFEVTVKVSERTKDGRQLDQGSFYRKWAVALDGEPPDPNAPVWGPEFVGQVHGDIQIGGADDYGKIRFPSFDAQRGASKEVNLLADANLKLETFKHEPAWIKVNLASEKTPPKTGRRSWTLEVIVPPNTLGARSFDEPDAVTLRIGDTQRFVRIPLEGHIGGH